MSSLFLLPGRFLWTALCPAVFATGAECEKWSADFGLSVTSRLLDSLMKFLRAGRSVRLWINLDANTPDYKKPISQTIAGVLMRRRSLQLLSRLRRSRSFPGFSAVWTFNANSRMLQSDILDFQRLLPHRITIQTGKSSQLVLSPHQQLLPPLQREAARSAMTVRRQQIASPSLSISKLSLKSRDQLSCETKGARNSCVGNRETFSESRRASQCQCSCGSCGYQSTC